MAKSSEVNFLILRSPNDVSPGYMYPQIHEQNLRKGLLKKSWLGTAEISMTKSVAPQTDEQNKWPGHKVTFGKKKGNGGLDEIYRNPFTPLYSDISLIDAVISYSRGRSPGVQHFMTGTA